MEDRCPNMMGRRLVRRMESSGTSTSSTVLSAIRCRVCTGEPARALRAVLLRPRRPGAPVPGHGTGTSDGPLTPPGHVARGRALSGAPLGAPPYIFRIRPRRAKHPSSHCGQIQWQCPASRGNVPRETGTTSTLGAERRGTGVRSRPPVLLPTCVARRRGAVRHVADAALGERPPPAAEDPRLVPRPLRTDKTHVLLESCSHTVIIPDTDE